MFIWLFIMFEQAYMQHVKGNFELSEYWMRCKEAVDAPWNDLQLFKKLTRYELINSLILKSSTRAFR
jgi:hypothetical protein